MKRTKLFRKFYTAALCLLLALLLLLSACSGEKASVPSLKEVEKYESICAAGRESVLAELGLSEEDVEWESDWKFEATVKKRRKIVGEDFIELLGFSSEDTGSLLVTLRFVYGTWSEDEAWEIIEKLYHECCTVYGEPDREFNDVRSPENRISYLLQEENRDWKNMPKEYWDVGEKTWFFLQMFHTDPGEVGIWLHYQFIHDPSRDFPTI
ncbi:hypothetical protein [Acutalibacter sp. 1XD8-33]|uniref:hypothetical protein n=1 Tax=Acutalibacter sp. 1XD8-33 TaxID=2320081 RepID=UPI0011C4A70C|nr:hypothetical protein [Acutalibacter sp. 1XD8-33]